MDINLPEWPKKLPESALKLAPKSIPTSAQKLIFLPESALKIAPKSIKMSFNFRILRLPWSS